MSQNTASDLVNEAVRFCAQALRLKAAELEQAAEGAESPAAALAAMSECLRTDALIELAEPLERAADGLPLYAGSTAEALAGFGEGADGLRAMLTEHEARAAE
jgi:hypothetical protein